MRIAKIENNKPIEITIGVVRRENRGVSFPNEPAESTLNKLGYYTINETAKPVYDRSTQTLEATLVFDSGVVTERWSVVDIPQEALVRRTITKAIKRRRQVERGGVYWTDSKGDKYWINTDDNSQVKMTSQLSLLSAGIVSGAQHWKVDAVVEKTHEEDGEVHTYEDREQVFRPTTESEFREMAAAVKDHVQKCFAIEATVAQMARLGVYTDFDTEFAKL